jgi:hypothetical protein
VKNKKVAISHKARKFDMDVFWDFPIDIPDAMSDGTTRRVKVLISVRGRVDFEHITVYIGFAQDSEEAPKTGGKGPTQLGAVLFNIDFVKTVGSDWICSCYFSRLELHCRVDITS